MDAKMAVSKVDYSAFLLGKRMAEKRDSSSAASLAATKDRYLVNK